MIKNLIKFGIFLIILLFTLVFYLSFFGINTKKFNSHISEKLTKTAPNLKIELKKVKLFLNIIEIITPELPSFYGNQFTQKICLKYSLKLMQVLAKTDKWKKYVTLYLNYFINIWQ